MITKFKIFEGRKRQPRRKDYIVVDVNSRDIDIDIKFFLNNNIGRIAYKTPFTYEDEYSVDYEYIPNELKGKFNSYKYGGKTHYWFSIMKDDIVHFSENKEDLEFYFNLKKYNL
jgi:hypothetical protein